MHYWFGQAFFYFQVKNKQNNKKLCKLPDSQLVVVEYKVKLSLILLIIYKAHCHSFFYNHLSELEAE